MFFFIFWGTIFSSMVVGGKIAFRWRGGDVVFCTGVYTQNFILGYKFN